MSTHREKSSRDRAVDADSSEPDPVALALSSLPPDDLLSPHIPALHALDLDDVVTCCTVLVRKMRVCTRFIPVCDGSSPSYNAYCAKTKHLNDIERFLSNDDVSSVILSEAAIYPDLIRFVSGNIFRSRPRPTYEAQGGIYDPEEDEPVSDPNWPVLKPVYQTLLRWALNKDLKIKAARKSVTKRFLSQLICLFDSEDHRERDYLKSILHRLYGRLSSHRAFIRTRIYDELATFTYETQRHNGIADFLDILGPIINGLNVPVKEEHVHMLLHVLMPLHIPPFLIMYYRNLSYCVLQFIAKEPCHARPVLNLLIRYWPKTAAQKSACFVDELGAILRILPPSELDSTTARRVAGALATSCASPHFQVAERALKLLDVDLIRQLITAHKDVMLPVLVPALTASAYGHWSQSVLSANAAALRALRDCDTLAFDSVAGRVQEMRRNEIASRARAKKVLEELRRDAYATAGTNTKLLRILCRVDAYLPPAQPADVHGLLLFGRPPLEQPALDDESLASISMKAHIDAASDAQATLIERLLVPQYDEVLGMDSALRSARSTPATPRTLRGGQAGAAAAAAAAAAATAAAAAAVEVVDKTLPAPRSRGGIRYDTPLVSPLTLPLNDADHRERDAQAQAQRTAVNAALAAGGYVTVPHMPGMRLAPTLTNRGKPTVSSFALTARIVTDAAETGLVPLSAPCDPAVLAENEALVRKIELGQAPAPAARSNGIFIPQLDLTPASPPTLPGILASPELGTAAPRWRRKSMLHLPPDSRSAPPAPAPALAPLPALPATLALTPPTISPMTDTGRGGAAAAAAPATGRVAGGLSAAAAAAVVQRLSGTTASRTSAKKSFSITGARSGAQKITAPDAPIDVPDDSNSSDY